MMFWGLPVLHLKQDFVSQFGRYPVDTITNAKAFECMHEYWHEPANDNDPDDRGPKGFRHPLFRKAVA